MCLCLIAEIGHAQNRDADSGGARPNPAAAMPEAPPLVSCPAGAPLGAVDLRVEAGGQALPFRTINNLSEGDTLLYSSVLRGKEKRSGEVALVLVPAMLKPGEEDILVTDPKDADKPQQWKMSRTMSLVALVYGPAGLNRKKVAKFLSQDQVLIAQLADYADKTAQAEQLVSTLSDSASSAASVNAALSGFASQYGFAVQIDKNAPTSAQAAAVFAAMNPQLANYNPLASSTAVRAGQTASLATMAGALFFGSPVGLAAGGTAMLLDLRAIAFPDTQFRASFAQSLPGTNVSLCGQQGPLPPHTRVAYIWANRIPNVAAPSIRLRDANFIPATQKTPVPVDVPEPGWKYLDRAHAWALVDGRQNKIEIPVVKLGNQKALEIDLTKATAPPGDYKLMAFWDQIPIEGMGTIHVLALSDFGQAHLDPASQDRLLAKSGKMLATVAGSDFEFTTKVELKRLNDEFATSQNVRFRLPKGLREGPQDRMDLQIDTQDLDPGAYELLISQQDGKSHPVPFKILPNPPEIENLPILANQGAAMQHFVLKGQRLELITKLEAPGAVLNLSPAASSQTERNLTVELQSPPNPGTKLAVKVYLQDRSEPLAFPDALEITGPLPVIASSKLSPPTGTAIALRPGELPAGYTLNAVLDVKNIERTSTVRVECADGVGEHGSLHVGEQTASSSLQQLSPDQLFLAYDTIHLPAGCSLQVTMDNGRGGSSQPFTLAHILRFPQVESFTVSQDQPQNGTRQYQITGQNLEMIEKLGWDETTAVAVSNLPAGVPGPGLKQSLSIRLPDPPQPDAMLDVWLRGDHQGRTTTIKAPVLPAPPPPPPTILEIPVPTAPARPAEQAAPPSEQAGRPAEQAAPDAPPPATQDHPTAPDSTAQPPQPPPQG